MPNQISDVWKWVALTLVAFLLGAGSSTIYGTAALRTHITESDKVSAQTVATEKERVEAKQEVDDKLHQYQADVHSRIVDMVEGNEKLLNDLRIGQAKVAAKLELILDREFDRHHRDDDDNNHN